MAKKKTVNPLVSQAQTATQLRYGPEIQGLATLRNAAASDYQQGARQARVAAQIIQAGAKQAQGGLADFLARAGHAQQAVGGPSQGEAQMVAQNLGLTTQAAGAGLANTISRAGEAAKFQTQGLRSKFDSDAAQIDDRLGQIQGESGTFAADYFNKLLNAEADRNVDLTRIQSTAEQAAARNRVTQRGQNLTHADRQASIAAQAQKDAAAEAKKHTGTLPGGAKPATNDAFSGFQKDYTAGLTLAQVFAKKVKDGSISAANAIAGIANGSGATTKTEYVRDPDTGEKIKSGTGYKTHEVKVPGFKGVGDTVAATAALEYAVHGGISSNTAKKLHAQGISAKRLGVKVIPQSTIEKNIRTRKQIKAIEGLI